MEELQQVKSFVKNQFLGLAVTYVKDGIDKNYFPDFVAQCKSNDGIIINLMIEITGMSKEKAEKNGL